jgi:uncharacterized protein
MRYSKFLFALPVLAYGLVVLVMYLIQDSLLYDPRRENVTPEQVGLSNVETIELISQDGIKIVAWYTPASASKPTILFFHGKGGNIGGRPHRYSYYTSKGYGVLFLSYRGYGPSEGEPSANGLIADAEASYDWLKSQGVEAKNIVVVGESMGTGVATILAANRPVAGIALEAPYSAIVDVAADRYWWMPVRFLMKENLEPIKVISNIRTPILMQLGDQDKSIPLEFGTKLFDAAKQPKELVVLAGFGHNDIFAETTWSRELAFFDRVIVQ